MHKAEQLYESLVKGETTLLVEHFPFIETAFTRMIEVPVPAAMPEKKRKLLQPPKVTHRASSDEDDLRDALDIGFSHLRFGSLEHEE